MNYNFSQKKEPRKGLFFLLSEIKASPLHC